MNVFRFIHCGDLHLGCSSSKSEMRFLDFFSAFDRLINYAIDKKAKYIIISGDLFHLKVINSKTLLATTNILEKARNHKIDVFVIEGNHDKAFYVDEESWLIYLHEKKYIKLLSHSIVNGKLLLSQQSIYEDDNIRIIGLNYMGGATSKYLKMLPEQILPSQKFTVLMLHASIHHWSEEEFGDIDYADLQILSNNVDYIALGHIHSHYEYKDFCFNPGSLENIRIKDGKKKNKGFFEVEVTGKNKTVKFIQASPRPSLAVDLDVSGYLTPKQIIDYVIDYSYNLPVNSLAEITLFGKVPFNPYLIDLVYLKDKLNEKYNFLQLDILNYINVIQEKSEKDIISRTALEKEIVSKLLKQSFPEQSAEKLKDLSSNILLLKQYIQDNQDDETIIKFLMNMEQII